MQELQVWSLGHENPLEKEMATHSSILAWEIPWTEEPGGLQSMGLQRVGHDLSIKTTVRNAFLTNINIVFNSLCVCVYFSNVFFFFSDSY